MSKHMQITVTVNPFYEEELEQAFPKLARHLGYLDAPLVKSNPSLYRLVTQLDKLLYAFDNTKVREVLLPHREKFKDHILFSPVPGSTGARFCRHTPL